MLIAVVFSKCIRVVSIQAIDGKMSIAPKPHFLLENEELCQSALEFYRSSGEITVFKWG
jgi:hypothetical protein